MGFDAVTLEAEIVDLGVECLLADTGANEIPFDLDEQLNGLVLCILKLGGALRFGCRHGYVF
jgi:hypothetical protein